MTTMMQALDAARAGWIAAIADGNQLWMAVAEAEAKATMLQQIKQQQIAAALLRFCDPELQMTEIVGQCGDSEKIRCTGLAILSGFTPGRHEYAIFGGRGNSPATVYVKEQGYRKLLSLLPDCQMGDVQVGYPRIEMLDGNVEVWAVEGRADCVVNGKQHAVEARGPFAIRLPVKRSRDGGMVTDNIDGIAAKARRRLLQQLWKKASGSSFVDDANDADAEAPEHVEVLDAHSMPIPAGVDPDAHWRDEAQSIADQIGEPHGPDVVTWFELLKQCGTIEQLAKDWGEFNKHVKQSKMDPRGIQFLDRWKRHLKEYIGGNQ